MTTLSPQLIALFAGTTGVGFLMMIAGVQKSALEWRRRRRSCPSCGRLIEGRVCGPCTSA
jgi:succinate dehydrogenase/fumarate reductase-like Fe-S protein